MRDAGEEIGVSGRRQRQLVAHAHENWDMLARNRKSGGRWLVGSERTYVDLSLFQVVEGCGTRSPNATACLEPTLPRLVALRDRVAERPRIAVYLKSKRRLPFNQMGIFLHYPELAAPSHRAPRRRR